MQPVDDYTRMGAARKTQIGARKETIFLKKSHQGEDRQAVDEYTRIGAKRKVSIDARKETIKKEELDQREHRQAVDQYTKTRYIICPVPWAWALNKKEDHRIKHKDFPYFFFSGLGVVTEQKLG